MCFSPATVRWFAALLLWPLVLLSCSKDESPAPSPEEQGASTDTEKAQVATKPAEEELQPLGTPPPLVAAPPPETNRVRPGAVTLLAQYTNGVLVPTATLQGTRWVPEEIQTLDKLPEGYRGKDARSDVVRKWWQRLGLEEGDTFMLRGSRGAKGTFTVRFEFATADRGGCVGLVWAIPGEVSWTVKPRGQTHWAAAERKREFIWAFRGPWIPPDTHPDRPLTDEETALARLTLKRIRHSIRKALPPPEGGGKWEECDSLTDPPCPSYRAGLFPVNIDQDQRMEAIATVQFKNPKPPAGMEHNAVPMESRLLIGLAKDDGYLLGKWDGDSSKMGEAARAPTFAGALDLTGDGRAELIFRKVEGETENFLVYQASAEKSGRWHLLFRTTTEGC